MKIELTNKEVILIIGALSLLSRIEESKELVSLRVKITGQHIEELKKQEGLNRTLKARKNKNDN